MKTVINIVLFTVLLGYSTGAFATGQLPDNLWYKGKEYSLHSNPMASFFEQHPDRLPVAPYVSTALWRGYVATFEISRKMLYVIEIRVPAEIPTYRDAMGEIFPEAEGPVPATWYTGTLVVPYGKVVGYVHEMYAAEYSRYMVMEVEEGIVVGTKKLNLEGYRKFREKESRAIQQIPEE